MSKIIKEAHIETFVRYTREFEWEGHKNCGYSFPCDEQGNIEELCPEGLQNYKNCMTGNMTTDGYKLIDLGVRKEVRKFHVNPSIECDCGEQFILFNEYMGACSCPNCEQWYNLFGQQLVNPTMWEEDY